MSCRSWVRTAVVVCALALGASPAAAERRHAIYVEALGKGGLWGLGYDLQLSHHFAVGVVGSYYMLGGDRFTTLSPYVAAYPVRRGAHGWLVQLGPQLVHRNTPSPVPEWDGMSTTKWNGELSTGYEYRSGVLVRAYLMGAIGARFAPGVGLSLGWTL